MKNAVFNFPLPANEPVKSYLKGSPERVALEAELKRQSGIQLDIPLIIGGKEVRTGNTGKVVMPHDHGHVLATYHKAGPEEVRMAIKAALDAHEEWAELDWTVRASIMLKIADLLAGKYRAVINAACMLGQSKNFYQAEIDSACETISCATMQHLPPRSTASSPRAARTRSIAWSTVLSRDSSSP